MTSHSYSLSVERCLDVVSHGSRGGLRAHRAHRDGLGLLIPLPPPAEVVFVCHL